MSYLRALYGRIPWIQLWRRYNGKWHHMLNRKEPDMTASNAANVIIRASAWILDTFIDVILHLRLVNDSRNESNISHDYARSIFDRCFSFTAYTLNTMKGLDELSLSMPKDCSSLLYKDAVPVVGILHGTNDVA
jgi:hypothetical protein